MNFLTMKDLLHKNTERINQLVRDVNLNQARWKPDPSSWSILEVINHLYDEEREDFRAHLDLILHYPQDPWTSINPGAWVSERGYNERDLESSLANFLNERRASLTWLEQMENPDWDTQYTIPIGSMRAGDMFSAWIAHDLLHIRQLVELHYAYLVELAQPYKVDYAGDW